MCSSSVSRPDLVRGDPEELELRKRVIHEACDAGDWRLVRVLIRSGLEAYPADAELMALSGYAYLQVQQFVDAERALSAALARGHDTADVRFHLAFAHFMQKRYVEALEHLTRPLVRSGFPLAALLRARCLQELARPVEAIAECRASLPVAPHDADLHGLLSLLLYEQGRCEEATPHIDAALSENPRQLEAMLALASSQADAGDYDAARRSFTALLDVYPRCGQAWLGLASVEAMLLQVEEARRAVERAAVHRAGHVRTWHVTAWIALMRSDIAAAERALDRALALDPECAETHGGLALAASLQGLDEDARVNVRRALRLDSQSMSAQCAQVVLLQADGRHWEALALFETLLTRPIAHRDRLYRDLIVAYLRYLRSRAAVALVPIVYH